EHSSVASRFRRGSRERTHPSDSTKGSTRSSVPEVGAKGDPVPWLTEILNGVEHANFFEARATEYSKGATQGDWHGDSGVWAMFDKRKPQTVLAN
ncbi:MAG: hypothetical protein VXW22_09325, partial [Pseudomonadota bacterium]|nr:hypothetical protein [Pseudomonadota bacterium]